MILARAVGEYRVLGGALDDALGEAYDKTARLLGLDVGGGGGPALEALARRGDPKAYRFPVPLRRRKDCDFSYAGLKTAVRLAIERDLGKPADGDAFARARGLSDGNDASAGDAEDPSFSAEETARRDAVRADIAASFQAAAVKHLEERTRRAIAWARESLANDTKEPSGGNLSCVVVAGGVAANATVRATLGAVASEAGLPLVLPPPRWCTDNGVMVAWAGVERFALGLAEEAPSAEQVSTPTEEEPGRKRGAGAAVAAVAAGHQRRARDGGGEELEDSANRAAAAGGARLRRKRLGSLKVHARCSLVFVRVRARVFFALRSNVAIPSVIRLRLRDEHAVSAVSAVSARTRSCVFITTKSRPQRPNRGNSRVTDQDRTNLSR